MWLDFQTGALRCICHIFCFNVVLRLFNANNCCHVRFNYKNCKSANSFEKHACKFENSSSQNTEICIQVLRQDSGVYEVAVA